MPVENNAVQNITTFSATLLKPSLEANLKNFAKEANWPDDVIAALSVDFDGSSLTVKYPDSLSDVIDDLEYGKPYDLPKPAIRPFIYNSDGYIEDVIAEYVLGLILDAEEVI